MTKPITFFEKAWNDHLIKDFGNNLYLLHVDRHFLHELSGATSFWGLEKAGRHVRNPDLTYATFDHVLDTFPGRGHETMIPNGKQFITKLKESAESFNISLFDLQSGQQGIVHVIAPELGIAQPGSTFVCGDSHTCTVGGIGALAWGVGSSDSEHVLATQTLVAPKPGTMLVNFSGQLSQGISPKDLILYLIGQITADGGNGFAIEFGGSVIRDMTIEGRLTICNMSIELSGQTGLVAPDETTFKYLYGKPFSPTGELWDKAVEYWRKLPSDPGAEYDKRVDVECSKIKPQVTWGTSPEHVIDIDGSVPSPEACESDRIRRGMEKALSYTGLEPGTPIEGLPIEGAFIGSCTNSRLSDLRAAANILQGFKIAPSVRAICTPGSSQVKIQAEKEGIKDIFVTAGFEWREPGCSLCMSAGAGGETFGEARRVISSTNRNFENRMGRGVTSHLASPETVAWSAINGKISDVRKLQYESKKI